MLRALVLENFKAFGGRRVIPIRPITLIFGPNSAGKSSIIQSLMVLKQTAARVETDDALLVTRGRLADLGSYRNMLFLHEGNRECEIAPIFALSEGTSSGWAGGPMIGHFSGPLRPALGSVGMGLRTRLGQEGNANLQELRFYCDDTSLPAFTLRMSRNARTSSPVLPVSEASVSEFEETAQEWTPISPQAHYLDRASINEDAQVWKEAFECHCQTVPVWEEFGELVDYVEKIRTGFRDMKLLLRNLNLNYAHGWGEAADSGRNNFDGSFDVPYLPELAQDIAYAQFRLLDRILYIGPQRNLPGRISIYSGLPTEDVGQSGEHLPDVLFSQHESMRKINEALRRLAIGYKIDIDQLTGRTSGASDVFSIQLVSDVNSLKVRLNDVGYGVSQVLPVVVQSLLAASRDLLIEQPELHLHPRLQAELADVFVQSAFEQKNTLLLETHSEHLILRLMRRIRETSRGTLPEGMPPLKPEDVSIIYVQPTENGSVPLVMDLDEDGELLTAWPNGFFEEGFRERFA